jgi:hypothetical protein
LAIECNRARGRRQQARDAAQQRCLARSIRTEKRDDFGAADAKIDPVQHTDLAVASMQSGDVEHKIIRQGRH